MTTVRHEVFDKMIISNQFDSSSDQRKRILVLSCQAFSLLHFRLDMMLRFLELGYEVFAAAPDNNPCWFEQLSSHGIHYVSFDLWRNGTNPIMDIKGYFALKNIIKIVKPDVVFTFQAKTVIYGTLAAHVCGVEEIYALIAGLGSIIRNINMNWKRKLLKNIMCIEYKVALRHAKTVFFHNHDDSQLFISRKLLDPNKIKYMNGSGVNTEHYTRQPMPMRTKKILFVGRYIADKGVREYLEAARLVKSKYPDVVFEMVGYYDTNPSAISEEEINKYIDDGLVIDHGKQEGTVKSSSQLWTPQPMSCRLFIE